MATEILPIASGAANSADVTVSSGVTLAVAIKSTSSILLSKAQFIVSLKDDGSNYQPIGVLDSSNPGAVLSAGVYRFSRTAASDSCGLFSA